MFDQIHFQKLVMKDVLKSSSPLTDHFFRFNVTLDTKDESIQEFIQAGADTSFALTGEASYILAPPVSSYAYEHLLYMQTFGLLDAGKSFYTKRENFSSYLLLFTYEGEGTLTYQDERYILSAGTGCLIDCWNPHIYQTSGEHWKHGLLHYSGGTAEGLYQQLISDGSPLFAAGPDSSFQQDLEKLLLINQTFHTYREFEFSIQLETLLMNLIRDKHLKREPAPDSIRRLQQYIEYSYTRPLTLDELCHTAGLSKYHLEREFKRYTGFSIMQYVIELRINQACMLLASTDLPISQISDMAGFSDYPNFLKLFKARKNMTPRQFRKRNHAEHSG